MEGKVTGSQAGSGSAVGLASWSQGRSPRVGKDGRLKGPGSRQSIRQATALRGLSLGQGMRWGGQDVGDGNRDNIPLWVVRTSTP